MNQTFSIGEIAIIQNVTGRHASLNGSECEIESFTHIDIFENTYSYVVKCADGVSRFAMVFQLRKKRPPTTGEESIISLFKTVKQPDLVPA